MQFSFKKYASFPSVLHTTYVPVRCVFPVLKKLPNFWPILTGKRNDQKERMSVVRVWENYSTIAILLNHLVSHGTLPLMSGAAEAGDPVDGSRAPRWVARLLDDARPRPLPYRPHRGRGEAAQPVPLQDRPHAQSGWRHRGKHQVKGTVQPNLRPPWKWYL